MPVTYVAALLMIQRELTAKTQLTGTGAYHICMELFSEQVAVVAIPT